MMGMIDMLPLLQRVVLLWILLLAVMKGNHHLVEGQQQQSQLLHPRVIPLTKTITKQNSKQLQTTTKSTTETTEFLHDESIQKQPFLMQFPLVPHHVKHPNATVVVERPRRRHRHLRSVAAADGDDASSPIQMGALYQGYGTHYVDLWVGTPNPQRQTLIVDTGSGMTAFPCSGCGTDCGKGHHVDNVYLEGESETFEKLACDSCHKGHCFGQVCKIGMSYQEGSSWDAFEAKDLVYIGGPHDHALTKDNGGSDDVDPNHAKAFSFKMVFGCQTHLTGLFKTQLADGIMGMDNAPTAFWRQMYDNKMIPHKTFSLCYTRQFHVNRDGTTAGALTVGGTDERLHKTPMVYTKATKSNGGKGFYIVHIRRVYLRHSDGGESAMTSDPAAKVISLSSVPERELNRGNNILDSGTTDTYFSSRIASEFQKVYQKFMGKAYTHDPMDITPEDIAKMPTILIQLAGDEELNKKLYPHASRVAGLAGDLDPEHPYDIIVAIPPSHYMEFDHKKNMYIARFYTDQGSGTVFGGNTIMGHDVYFDVDKGQVGFAESTCDYLDLIETAGFKKTAEKEKEEEAEETAREEKAEAKGEKTNVHESLSFKDKIAQIHPAVAACSDVACQGSVAGILLIFMSIGILMGRSCQESRKKERKIVREMEMRDRGSRFRDDDDDEEESDEEYEDDDEEYEDDDEEYEDDEDDDEEDSEEE